MKHTLTRVNDTEDMVSTICKSVNILTAIRWIKVAWESVSEETIMNCFRKCGISAETTSSVEEGDPFADLDVEAQDMSSLNELVRQINPNMTEVILMLKKICPRALYLKVTMKGIGERESVQQLFVKLKAVQQRGLLWKKRKTQVKMMRKKSNFPAFKVLILPLLCPEIYILLFLESKGEEKAAEDQQQVISFLEDAKFVQ